MVFVSGAAIVLMNFVLKQRSYCGLPGAPKHVTHITLGRASWCLHETCLEKSALPREAWGLTLGVRAKWHPLCAIRKAQFETRKRSRSCCSYCVVIPITAAFSPKASPLRSEPARENFQERDDFRSRQAWIWERRDLIFQRRKTAGCARPERQKPHRQ